MTPPKPSPVPQAILDAAKKHADETNVIRAADGIRSSVKLELRLNIVGKPSEGIVAYYAGALLGFIKIWPVTEGTHPAQKK